MTDLDPRQLANLGFTRDRVQEIEERLWLRNHEHAWSTGGYVPDDVACHHYVHPVQYPKSKCPRCKGKGVTRYEKQVEFHELDATYRAWFAGVGSGKSKLGAAEAIRFVVDNPGANFIVSAPTYKILRQSTELYLRAHLLPGVIEEQSRADGWIRLKNDSTFWLRSTDNPDAVRGIDAAGFWLDEGAYASERAWLILTGRLRQPGYQKQGILTTSPKGRNWCWEVFVGRPDKDPALRDHYAYMQTATADNPFLSAQDIELMYLAAGDSLWAKQELEAQFIAVEGVVYPMFNRSVHVGKYRDRDFVDYVWGHDFGYVNPSVVLLFGVDSDKRLYCIDEFHESNVDTDRLYEEVRRMEDRWGLKNKPHVYDPSEKALAETWNKRGLIMERANNDVEQGIRLVASMLERQRDGRPRLVFDEGCVKTINEFEQYHYPEAKEGQNAPEKPAKEFDHGADATRYVAMWSELRHGRGLRALSEESVGRVAVRRWLG